MEYLTTKDYAFPGNSEFTYGAVRQNGLQKKCDPFMRETERINNTTNRDETKDKKDTGRGLTKKDAGISNLLAGVSSRTDNTGEKVKLGLNFSRSSKMMHKESLLDDVTLTKINSNATVLTGDFVEVVDLTYSTSGYEQMTQEIREEPEGCALEPESDNMMTEEEEKRHRFCSYNEFSSGKDKDSKRKRKKSLLMCSNLENNNNLSKTANCELFSEEISDSDDNSSGAFVLGKRRWRNPAQLAEEYGGKMMKIKRTKDGVKVSFTCKMNHRFSLMSHEDEGWCKVCHTLLKNAKSHAEINRGKLLSKSLEAELEFECEKGHRWGISYKKCLRNWCKVCKKERKKMVKEILAEEKKRVEEERKHKQDKMLEEARLRMIKENSQNQQDCEAEIRTFRILEDEISRIASKYAREFVQKSPSSDFEQMVELYKVLILPEKSLRLYFKALTKIDLKKKFRRYTILLHPDKNCHPKAKAAFQKIYSIFEGVVQERKRNEELSKPAEN